jgi:hypothetical protein
MRSVSRISKGIRRLAPASEIILTASSKDWGVRDERRLGDKASARVFKKSSVNVEPKPAEEAE